MQIVLSMEFNSGEEKNHICSYCGKRFSSGKALGGHKRFHIQQKRQAAAEAVAKACTDQDSGGNNNNNNGSSRFYCPVCPKHFPSLKSVSGHMRTHGDRVWRGINPPAPADNNLHNKPTTTTTTVDLLQSLPSNWSNIGGKRGRKFNPDTTSPSIAAAIQLIKLSQSKDRVFTKQNGAGLKRKVMMIKKNNGSVNSSSNSTETTTDHKDDEKNVSNKKLKIRFGTSSNSTKCYKCNSCDKSFTTFQALGGHSSTHNKDNNHKKNCTTKKMDSKLLRPNKYFYGDQGSGHGDVLQIMMGSSISSSSQLIAMDHGGNCSSTAAERRRTLDIDLNELPVMSVTDV
uniref:C2H2-type domain-containing protein n=1 Tax=Cannabis sativa TaxID=3483 RepID=A0A803PY55_CANSA